MSLADSDKTLAPAKKVIVAHISERFTQDSSPKESLAMKFGGRRILKTYNKETKKLLVAVQEPLLREAFMIAAKQHEMIHKVGRAPQHALGGHATSFGIRHR